MPAWITDLIPLAPWVAVIALLVWVGFKVFPWLRKIMHFIDDVTGEPARAGIPARPGLMERVGTMETKQDEQAVALAVVRHEVTTNHGSSLKDAVKSVDAAVSDLASWQEKHEKKSDVIVQRIDGIEKHLKENP